MRLDHSLLKLPRQYCADTLLAEISALPREAWIQHPGKLVGNDAVPLITPGGEITNGFAGPMAPTEHLRKCPYIMEIMSELGGVWGRSRLMGLAPGADVPEHVDIGYYWRTHLRIHIPVVTTPKVLFTCDGESVHMAAGECWVFDTFKMHNVRNGGTEKRIHLVLDTVGGENLWDLIDEAQRAPEDGLSPVKRLQPGEVPAETLALERVNAPEIMSPWEIRCHVDFLLAHAPPAPSLEFVAARLDRFAIGWSAAWAQFGNTSAGIPAYRQLLADIQKTLKEARADGIVLPNQVPLDRALSELIFQVAVAGPAPQPPVAANAVLQAARSR